MKSLKKAFEEVKLMQKYLTERPDDKLIEGYKKATEDYEKTGDERIKAARDAIKTEIDKRGLKIDNS